MAHDYLTEANVDDLARMVTALLAEVWVIRDRVAVTEYLLAQKAGVSTADIDAFVPPPELAAELQRLRDRMMVNVVGAPANARDRSVAGILGAVGLKPPA